MDEENVVHAHNGTLFNHKKESNSVIYSKRNKLENIMLSETVQAQKDKYCTFSDEEAK